MFARTKRFFIVTAVLATFAPSSASADGSDMCFLLAGINPNEVLMAMTKFSGPVLGKHPEDWSKEDMENLRRNAQMCDGLPADGSEQVKASSWNSIVIAIEDRISGIAKQSATIRAYFQPTWGESPLPVCSDLLKWERDPVWLRSNSREIFGEDLGRMSEKKRAIALEFAKACIPVMKDVLRAWRHRGNAAELFVADMERSAARDALAYAEMDGLKNAYISVEFQGWQIPRAYLGNTARSMVEMAERAMRENGRLSLEQMSVLSSWIDTVYDTGQDGPERAYANFIRTMVSKQMFKKD
ncbi:hypothetical protein [Roseibium sp. RKSG952]|uniref:hypothetical protein n=1 Tax=Roseibium sp. RKSG952 TaxID=2529384 RepID=UPI0012BB833E|nr:hypothetical protein [Roseibium sp. RKSG952]MTH95175.1 hypothetical protein [Roseibium sp. RKSG952]